MMCDWCVQRILPDEQAVTKEGRTYHEECWADVELDLADQDR